ncbi:MAG: flagellar basal-body rod protein FlgG [Phycisphaeraceae bacterium]|nr:flagellar basal-body rod protein FlgG [Phycisphaeraceae bacterium]
MAITALDSAASGLSALNTALDVTANNLANVNTQGFKGSRANFQDLLYVERAQPGVENSIGDQRPTGLYVGLGVKVSGTQVDFEQGAPIATGRELDVTISGRGFFRVKVQDSLGDGYAYTRAGNFALNRDGEIVLASDQGRRLEPNIQIPEDATAISIQDNGEVYVDRPGLTDPELVGQMEIATFINPQGLKSIGENLFLQTDASGPPVLGTPGEDQRGSLKQKFVENSNVDPTVELINLIKTQRAFEMNSNTIRTADETLRTVATLKR